MPGAGGDGVRHVTQGKPDDRLVAQLGDDAGQAVERGLVLAQHHGVAHVGLPHGLGEHRHHAEAAGELTLGAGVGQGKRGGEADAAVGVGEGGQQRLDGALAVDQGVRAGRLAKGVNRVEGQDEVIVLQGTAQHVVLAERAGHEQVEGRALEAGGVAGVGLAGGEAVGAAAGWP